MRALAIIVMLCLSPAGLQAQNLSPEQIAEDAKRDAELQRLFDQGRYAEALPLAGQLLALREKWFGAEHPKTGDTLRALASFDLGLGHFDEGEVLARRALAIYEKNPGPDDPETASTVGVLADLLNQLYRLDEAEALYRRQVSILEKALGPEASDIADALDGLGMALQREAKYDAAAAIFDRDVVIRVGAMEKAKPGAELDALTKTARSYGFMADFFAARGQYAAAEQTYLVVLDPLKEILGEDHPHTLDVMNNLAVLYGQEGQTAKQLDLFRHVLAIQEKAAGPESPGVALSMSNLAVALQNYGDFANAEELLGKALVIFEKTVGPEHPKTAEALMNLADAYESQRKFDQSDPLYRRALAIREKALGPEHPVTALTLNNLAESLETRGKYEEAEKLLRRALSIHEKALGPEAPETSLDISNLALVLWREKKPQEISGLLARGAAADEHGLAMNLAGGGEARRLEFAARFEAGTEELISFQNSFPGADVLRLAWEAVLRRKGRVLDSMAGDQQALRKRLGEDERKNFDELIAVRSALAALYLDGPGAGDASAYRQAGETARAKEEELLKQLQIQSPMIRAQVNPPRLPDVQAALPERTVLLEYVRYQPLDPSNLSQQWGPWRYGVFRADQTGDPAWVDLGEAAPIERLIQQWRVEVARPGAGNGGTAVGRQLYAAVLAPVLPKEEARSLFIAPEGALHLLPWAALPDAGGRVLLDRYQISLLDSGRDVLKFAAQSKPRGPSLIVANPAFGEAPGTVSVSSAGQSADLQPVQWPALPGTHAEADAVRQQLGGDAVLLEGRVATKSALMQVHGPRILHVATHGFFLADQPQAAFTDKPQAALATGSRGVKANAQAGSRKATENPLLRSGIVLAGANRPQSAGESILTALEAAQLDLEGTALVTLSACQTGLGDVQSGEGVFGLKRALAVAGAQAELISLWEVDDHATAELMGIFYEELGKGRGRAEALRTAQQKLAVEYNAPYYWAAFALSGDPGPLPR